MFCIVSEECGGGPLVSILHIRRGMVQPTAAALLEMTNKEGGAHVATRWLSFLQTLKEYEIITLIYNRKSCRLDLLSYCAPKDIILKSIRLGSTMFEAKRVGAKANW